MNKKSSIQYRIAYVLLGTLLVYLSSLINYTIPSIDIPISAQSLAVLLVAYLWKEKTGILAVILYVVLGSLGLPIFASASSGLSVLRGNSGGFIYGFILAAWYVEQARPKDSIVSFLRLVFTMSIGTGLILILGYMHLSLLIGTEVAFDHGIKPFLPGAIVKILLGAGIIKLAISRSLKD